MAVAVDSTLEKKAMGRIAVLIGKTLEEELFTLNSLQPGAIRELPSTFADSVIICARSILGEDTGEALLRFIGEERLSNPTEVYRRLDSFLHGGSEVLKTAIREEFRVKVHGLYKLAVDMAPPTQDIF